MLRVSLVGPGDKKYHFTELLKLSEKEVERHIEGIARALTESGSEIVLLPDKGTSFEVARKYKSLGGKKVFGTIPFSDTDFGIKHLEEYINAEVDGKKLIDEQIDTNNWYKQDMTCCIFGDIVLFLGKSLGSVRELVSGHYLYKLFLGMKADVKVMKKKIHPEVRAGETIPFSVIVYKPFVKNKLGSEIESYIKKTGGKVLYVSGSKELKETLLKLSKS